MGNKNVKRYEEFVINTRLFEKIVETDVESETKIEYVINKNNYEKRYFNQLLMSDVINDNLFESVEDAALKIHTDDWVKDPVEFYDSFMESDKIEFLTPYSIDEIKNFNVFKLKGYNIGFAIKKDGDIILVHNNSNIKGIGKILMRKAIEHGGVKLDHFDGFLTGFYRSIGFKLTDNDMFVEEYAPETWDYKPVDIHNPKTSIYPVELDVDENIFEEAEVRYSEGKPDVAYRIIN